MNTNTTGQSTTRRSVLKAGLCWAAAPALSAMASTAREDGRTLVVLHLAGGNDGLNTLIPHTDPLYRELRPTLSTAANNAIPIADGVALHASLRSLLPLYSRGQLAFVQGVGCPTPDYSHVGSCATRSRDLAASLQQPEMVLAGARTHRQVVLTPAAQQDPVQLDYQPGQIRHELRRVARMVCSPRAPRIVLARVGGFDTHIDQLPAHARILRELGHGLARYQRHVEEAGVADRVVLVAWSEFGRRIAENADGGTDHGSAGLMMVLGSKVRGGVYGPTPSLRSTDFGNLIPGVNFTSAVASLAGGWLGTPTPDRANGLRLI
jgi:uncharacterized protein (DUF1501 family)